MDRDRLAGFAENFKPLEFIDDAIAATQVFVDGHVVPGDLFLSVRNEIGAILGVVLAGLSHEIAETFHELKANFVGVVYLWLVHGLE